MSVKDILKREIKRNSILAFLYDKIYFKYVLWKRCKISIRNYGLHNAVDFPNDTYSNNFIITFRGNNNSVKVGRNCTFKMTNSIYVQGDNNVVEIGDNVTFDQDILIVVGEGTKVTIGSDCIFAYRVHIRTTDQHAIYDENRKRINPAKDVYIGNHVWLGKEAIIMKGVKVGDGAIIGMDSMVTKNVPERCIAAGKPAKVIRTNIYWDE